RMGGAVPYLRRSHVHRPERAPPPPRARTPRLTARRGRSGGELPGEPELLHHRHVVGEAPPFDGTPVLESKDAEGRDVEGAPRRWDAHEPPGVRPGAATVRDRERAVTQHEVER